MNIRTPKNLASIPRETFTYQDKVLYLQKRIRIEDVADLNGLKRWYNPDVLLKKDGHYYFCREIEEAFVYWEDKELGGEIFRVDYNKEPEKKKHIVQSRKRNMNRKRKMNKR